MPETKCPTCGCRMVGGICQNYGCEHSSELIVSGLRKRRKVNPRVTKLRVRKPNDGATHVDMLVEQFKVAFSPETNRERALLDLWMEAKHPLSGKRFIFALDLKHAEWLANRLRFGKRGDWFYVRDAFQLRGIREETLLVFGDYQCSPNWEEVNDTAQAFGWTILKVNDR